MVKITKVPLVSLGLGLAALPAQAVTVAGNPADYLVAPGAGLDGVAEIRYSKQSAPGLELSCSGSLLGTGRHVLTAAHCFTNPSGVLDVNQFSGTFFDLPSGRQGVGAKNFFIHPNWTPSTNSSIGINDVAIVELASEAPAEANRYEIYRNNNEVGQNGLKVGYGRSGNGSEGAVLINGVKRSGQNRYDALGDVFLQSAGFADSILPGTQLASDFDNGSPANDGFGFTYSLPDTALGSLEVFPAAGDSGAPAFLFDGQSFQIAGITSFSTRVAFLADAATSDVNNQLDSSFGEFAVDTRISSYADWIDSTLAPTSVPEPSTALGTLVFAAIPAWRIRSSWLKRKQK